MNRSLVWFRGVAGSVCRKVSSASAQVRSVACGLIAAVVAFAGGSVAQAQVTLPDPGVDTAGFITATITALGAVVAVAVGGYFAFILIKMGLRWARKIVG